MKILGFAIAVLIASNAFAQTDAGLATPTGHEVNAAVGSYTYTEPGAQGISIHGVKAGGEYMATLSLSRSRHWFGQADVRGVVGDVNYTGWCSPFLISGRSLKSRRRFDEAVEFVDVGPAHRFAAVLSISPATLNGCGNKSEDFGKNKFDCQALVFNTEESEWFAN